MEDIKHLLNGFLAVESPMPPIYEVFVYEIRTMISSYPQATPHKEFCITPYKRRPCWWMEMTKMIQEYFLFYQIVLIDCSNKNVMVMAGLLFGMSLIADIKICKALLLE